MSSASRKHCKKKRLCLDRPLENRTICRQALVVQSSRQVGAIVHAARLKATALPVVDATARQSLGPVPMIFGNRVFAARPSGYLVAGTGGVARACNTACLNTCSASVGVRCETCSARISCVRTLFSWCYGILEMGLDRRRELMSSAKTICHYRGRRRFAATCQRSFRPFG
jgi:hypothetical protein